MAFRVTEIVKLFPASGINDGTNPPGLRPARSDPDRAHITADTGAPQGGETQPAVKRRLALRRPRLTKRLTHSTVPIV